MPATLLALAAALATALVTTAALGLAGTHLRLLAAAIGASAAWAALGAGPGRQFLMLGALVAFIERASAPLLAGPTTTPASIAAAAGALLALATAGLAASVLRRERR